MSNKGINKVTIIGFLGSDPDIRYTNDQRAIANLSIATSESWKNKNTGQTQEKTEWHRIVIFGPLAGIAGKYLKKGSQVYIEGKLQTNKWQDNTGVTRYTTEIVVDGFSGQMQMLGSRGTDDGSYQKNSAQPQTAQQKQYPAQTKTEPQSTQTSSVPMQETAQIDAPWMDDIPF